MSEQKLYMKSNKLSVDLRDRIVKRHISGEGCKNQTEQLSMKDLSQGGDKEPNDYSDRTT